MEYQFNALHLIHSESRLYCHIHDFYFIRVIFKYEIFAAKQKNMEKKAIYKIFSFTFQNYLPTKLHCVTAENTVNLILYRRATLK
jgi:hypothetical protein